MPLGLRDEAERWRPVFDRVLADLQVKAVPEAPPPPPGLWVPPTAPPLPVPPAPVAPGKPLPPLGP